MEILLSCGHISVEFSVEDLPRAMEDRDRWQERVKGNHAILLNMMIMIYYGKA